MFYNEINGEVKYDYSGNIKSIGGQPVKYDWNGKIANIGDHSVKYDWNGKIANIGDRSVEYELFGDNMTYVGSRKVYDFPSDTSSDGSAGSVMVVLLVLAIGIYLFAGRGYQLPSIAQTVQQSSISQSQSAIAIVSSKGLNVRSTPNPDLDNIIKTLKSGEMVMLTGQVAVYNGKEWKEVNIEGKNGWVNAEHLDVQPLAQGIAIVLSKGLNVRSTPNPDLDNIIKTLKSGEMVMLTGQVAVYNGKEWKEVNIDGKNGWVNAEHLNVP